MNYNNNSVVIELFKRPARSVVAAIVPIKDKLSDLESYLIEWGTAHGIDIESKQFIYAEKIAKMAFAQLLDGGNVH